MAQQGDFWTNLIAGAKADGLDLGHDHYLRWTSDDASLTDDDVIGASLIHRPGPMGTPGEDWCLSAIRFAGTSYARAHSDWTYWTVETFEPLTLSPSIHCECGDHGYIRNGLWLPA